MSSRTEIYEIIKYKGVYFNETSNKWNVKSYYIYYIRHSFKPKFKFSKFFNNLSCFFL